MLNEEKNDEKINEEIVCQYELPKEIAEKIRGVIENLAVVSHEVYINALESNVNDKHAFAIAISITGVPWAFGLKLLDKSLDEPARFEDISGEAWTLAVLIAEDVAADFSERTEDEDDEDEGADEGADEKDF